VPVEKIIETIDQPDWLAERRKEILQQLESSRDAASADADLVSESESEGNSSHLEDFTSLLNAAAKKKPQDD
jgi:hypothetical protein